MDRRNFIRISSVALLPIALGLFPDRKEDGSYTIKVNSNRSFGHLLRTNTHTEPTIHSKIDTVIVGGGIAGVAAAYQLRNESFRLFEGGETLGGSSGAGDWKSARFATGAHYELAYPKEFGSLLIQTLQELGIIQWNATTELYEFTDKKYVISTEKMEQCFIAGELVEDILDEVGDISGFEKLLATYKNEMFLPTRIIDDKHLHLSAVTFSDFLQEQGVLTNELKERIDYQMMDDWGAKSDVVSALAGIHYYTCRPYDDKVVELFSPPQGNYYFIEKMIGALQKIDAVECNAMVSAIKIKEDKVFVDVLRRNGEKERVEANQVIYAGQKHTLKYIMPEAFPLFDQNEYAPWAVVNLICDKKVNFGKWQNDVLSQEETFLGFVDSNYQHNRSDAYNVITAYYCFEPKQREELVNIESSPDQWVKEVIELIELETDTPLSRFVKHVEIKLMGHAMPIPGVNYLNLKSVPDYDQKIVFAGVDTGRLPLFSEAFDSGLEAANKVLLNQEEMKNES